LFHKAAKEVDEANLIEGAKLDIEDSKTAVADYESKIAGLLAHDKDISRDKSEAATETDKWGSIAKKAVEAGNDEDAKKALEKKAGAYKRLTTLQKQSLDNNVLIERLRIKLNEAKAKIDKAETDHAGLSARIKGAEIEKELTGASADLEGGALSRLNKLADMAESMEDMNEAREELSSGGAFGLESKYAEGSDVDEELSKLKASMKE
jgi:phage shock protein A